MKTIIFATLAFLCNISQASPQYSEGQCIAIAKMGEVAANLRNDGVPEEDFVKMAAKDLHKKSLPAVKLVVAYVYTMQLNPADARKLVYLKCSAGSYNNV